MTAGHGFSYRPALDGLRAVAVLSVIAYHLDWPATPGGFLGVDVFFVLSGYLITSLLVTERDLHGTIAFAAFWARRARRLLPAALLLLVGVSIYTVTLAPGVQAPDLRGDGLAALLYVANWHLIASEQSYFALFQQPSPLRHMWSLAIEEQFYLLWPLLVGGTLALWRSRRALAAVCVVGAIASVLVMATTYDAVDPSRSYYGTDSRAHALLVGALLALVLHRWRPGRSARTLEVAGVVALVGIGWAIARVGHRDAFFYHGGSLLFAGVVAVLIAAVVEPGRRPLQRLLCWAPLRRVGTISYGLYLWHWPVIVVMTPSRMGIDGLRLDAVRVVTTFAIAVASYVVVERPIRHGGISNRRLMSFAPVAMLLVAALLSVTTVLRREPLPRALDTSAPITAPPAPPSTQARSSVASPPTAPPSTAPPGAQPPGTPVVDRGMPERMAVVGDSVAATLLWGLEEVAPAFGISVIPSTFAGCGIASGFVVDEQGRPYDWSEACYEAVPVAHEELIANHAPDLVVWLSTWELSDRLVDGRVVKYGTEEGDRMLTASMDDALRRLTAGGARVVMLTVAPRAASDVAGADDDSTGDIRRYTDLMERVAARSESVSVVDLAAILCPDGPPCPAEVEGRRLRPDDGWHFTESTAPWVAESVLPSIVEAYRHG